MASVVYQWRRAGEELSARNKARCLKALAALAGGAAG